jgi:hypothetical protein
MSGLLVFSLVIGIICIIDVAIICLVAWGTK